MKVPEKIITAVNDSEAAEDIMELTECFISGVHPSKVFLFGSFADGTYTENSDYDFYIVIDDGKSVRNASFLANKSIRNKMKRPVDIVVGTNSRFRNIGKSQNSLMIESEVRRNGILLYDSSEGTNWQMNDRIISQSGERVPEWKEWLRFAQMDYDCA